MRSPGEPIAEGSKGSPVLETASRSTSGTSSSPATMLRRQIIYRQSAVLRPVDSSMSNKISHVLVRLHIRCGVYGLLHKAKIGRAVGVLLNFRESIWFVLGGIIAAGLAYLVGWELEADRVIDFYISLSIGAPFFLVGGLLAGARVLSCNRLVAFRK
jgi:hypothetical protein